MAKKDGDKKAMDQKAMLDAFIAKFGMGEIVKDLIGDVNPDMTFFEFTQMLEDRQVTEVVMDMTLKELFGVKSKPTDQSTLKENIVELLDKQPGLTVSQISEELSEERKHLSVAMAALKKAGKVLSEGEKRNMKYFLPEPE